MYLCTLTGLKSACSSSVICLASILNFLDDWNADGHVSTGDGGFLSSNYGVNVSQLCTVGIDHHSG